MSHLSSTTNHFLVVANFKSNLSQQQVQSWLETVKPKEGMVVAPSFPHLSLFKALRHSSSTDLQLCAQDVSPFPPGSYTGAVSSRDLKDLGVNYCIVGHSERRHYFHETPIEVAAKVRELIEVGITPLICMELDQISSQFASLDPDLYDQCYFCFEPAGQIGGTVPATEGDILTAKKQIESFVHNPRFIYGGSVNRGNVQSLLKLGINGLLVATASLDPTHYQDILGLVSHAS